jgi:hypothetical protein
MSIVLFSSYTVPSYVAGTGQDKVWLAGARKYFMSLARVAYACDGDSLHQESVSSP